MPEQEEKSLSDWQIDIQRHGRSVWLRFYAELLGSAVSNPARFYRVLKLYGDYAMFEAIVATSFATITGDPLAYVTKVASTKWREAQEAQKEEEQYLAEIAEAVKISQQKNDRLEKIVSRLKKVKK